MKDANAVEAFIATWATTGGSELANTQSFVNGLCSILGVAPPLGSKTDDSLNDYVFERRVFQNNGDGTESFGRIDCYKRSHFVLEAKQGSAADRIAVDQAEADLDLFGQTASQRLKRGTARRGTPGWTKSMVQAKGQAERYAKALPIDHGWPPFLLITDVGYCIEVFADFSRTGKAYVQFPDRSSFRIMLDDLHDSSVRARLQAIWTDPQTLDPSAKSAKATREIALLLATVAKRLEARGNSPETTSNFLTKLLFTLFADSTNLLPKNSFSKLLEAQRGNPGNLQHQLKALWEAMDQGSFSPALGTMVRRFNGYLFKDTSTLEIDEDELEVLIAAAAADWTLVEPAIFGTLLERALNPLERAKLGAHYTPRTYVEHLITPTIIEPLRADWIGVRAAAVTLLEAGKEMEARRYVESFHATLAQIRVLDPACGTGNFLYVAMARMKELESEVVDLLSDLGDYQYVAEMSGHTITPENFLGIEINPRAAAIAQLVLWIGYLQWHLKLSGKDSSPAEPILRDIRTIEHRDALISWDDIVVSTDEAGKPLTRWDGTTLKTHPTTRNLVPDETAQVEIYTYVRPKPAVWPFADFIVGNPPFIGNKRMRERLGDGYVESVRKCYPKVPEAVDFVMYWWSKAAAATSKGKSRRFGLITTNSITQAFNRRVLEEASPVRVIYAIPNHPWIDSSDGADVRIAMTVGTITPGISTLDTVTTELELEGGFGEVAVTLERTVGDLNADLRIGADVHSAQPLRSNRGLACPGVQLSGQGFVVSADEVRVFSELTRVDLLKRYLTGGEITGHPKHRFVIDSFGLTEDQLRVRYPDAYQHLLTTVYPERKQNPRAQYSKNWWIHSEPRTTFRKAFQSINRYCATSRTSKHRVFIFCDNDTLPETKVLIVALDDAFHLGVLTSRFHVHFSEVAGAHLGVGDDPTYNHSECFDPFPFPSPVPEPLKSKIRREVEALDALRKKVLDDHPDLTITLLYNVLQAVRLGDTLSDKESSIHERGLVSVILSHHDEIDRLVADAYGWPHNISNAEALTRLLHLNMQRAAEEEHGHVKWLRPEFQAPAESMSVPAALDLPHPAKALESSRLLSWPKELPDQVTAVAELLHFRAKPVTAADLARAFKGKRAATLEPILKALAAIGQARLLKDGRYAP